ncbi:MAG TPA: response regulator [Bacteroidia bacterium]|nr:response regulator [Bacteroidia bacterium]HNU33347.1 response regulator [Bacteroidia bacterium]
MANRILVVDDEADLELLITQRFRSRIRAGELSFEFARNGAEALTKLKNDSSIDIVFTDINMPVMDGLTFLTKIKEENLMPKAVVISAYGDMENIRVAMNRGAFDFITKPIDMNDLETTLHKAISEFEVIRQGVQAKVDLERTTREKEIAIIEKQKAEEAKKIEQMFLANMSHEIRTPMNAIIGMTNLVLKTKLDEGQQKYLKIIKTSSENLLVILNDILDLSKMEAGKLHFENIPFSIRDVMGTVYESLKIKTDEKNLEIILEIDPTVPAYVMGDPVRMSQVMINLVGNAIKFTEKGSVTVYANTVFVNEEEGKCKVRFGVKDTGIGIPSEKLEKIFESFSQASSETTRKYGGTGLGLTISKQIVDLAKGRIHVTSEVGKGSEFSFEIRFKITSEPVAAKNNQQVSANDLKDIAVLLVEDNMFNQTVAVDTLNDLIPGIKIDIADNGQIALDTLKKNKYDLVIMDVQMPVMDGYTATKNIRQNFEAPLNNIPILAMTANVIKEEIDQCYAAGMNDYISKPFDPDLLLSKIAALVLK